MHGKDITYLGGDMFDYNDAITLMNGTDNFFLLVFTRAICNTTSHLYLLSVGPIHVGGTGLYIHFIMAGNRRLLEKMVLYPSSDRRGRADYYLPLPAITCPPDRVQVGK